MGEIWVFVVLLLVAAPIVVLVMLATGASRLAELSRQVGAFEARLRELEQRGAGQGSPPSEHAPASTPAPGASVPAVPDVAPPVIPPPPVTVPVTSQRPLVPPPPRQVPVVPPPIPPAPSPPALSRPPGADLETLVGGKWALWAGLLLVLLAGSFGLAYGWSHVPPVGRVSAGLLAGLVFIALGQWARGRQFQPWYHQGLTALGIGLLYLSVWACAMKYGLLPTIPAFAGMALVTAGAVALALQQDAPGLLLLATLGGYLTPVLLRGQSGGGGEATYFWAYTTALNAGILGAAAWKRWREVGLVAFAASIMLMGGWLASSYSPSMRGTTFAFLTANFLIFVGIATAYTFRLRVPAAPGDLPMVIGASAAYFTAAMSIMPATGAHERGWFSLALAAFFGLLSWAVRERVREDANLLLTCIGSAIAFATVAFPLMLGGNPLISAWAVEATLLAIAGWRTSRSGYTYAAACIWAVALCLLLWHGYHDPAWYPLLLWNARVATYLVVMLATAVMAWVMLAAAREHGTPAGAANLVACIAGVLALSLIERELHAAFEGFGWGGEHASAARWLAVAAVWTVAARLLMALGERLRVPGLSWPAVPIIVTGPPVVAIAGLGCLNAPWPPFWNVRFVASAAMALTLAGVCRPSGRTGSALSPPLTTWASVAAPLLVVSAVSSDICAGFLASRFPDPLSWPAAAALALAAVWAAAATALVATGFAAGSAALRWTGLTLGLCATLTALLVSTQPSVQSWLPFVSLRGLGFLLLVGMAVAMAQLYAANAAALTPSEQEAKAAPGLGVMADFLLLWALTVETYHWFAWAQYPSPETWRNGAQLGVSVVWTLYAAGLLMAGILRRTSTARWLGLGLFGIAFLKLFVLDLSFLSLPYRMVSFGVLGLILIAVAYLYSRYGEQIRDWARAAEGPDDV